ncbi:MAG TPA: MFS transporter [Frankiaceae bacterium]|nr:MFS transporter [Frankiaceae bacterium]
MNAEPLSSEVRRLIGGNTLSAIGTGFTLPFLLIYLTDARGLGVGTAANAIAVLGIAGLLTVPLMGWLSDRVGPWRVLVGALLVEGVATALFAGVTRPWHAFATLALLGIGQAATWPSQSALIAQLVPAERRARVYAVQFALLNLGIGVGGAVSGLVVDEARVGTFQAIYLVDALSFAVYAVVLLTLRHAALRPPPRPPEGGPSGYGDLLRDRAFLRVCLVTLLMSTAGYGQIYAGFPGFATDVAGVSTRVLGLAFAANTFVIVAAQMSVQRRLQGHRRSRALMGVGLVWAASWAVIGSAALTAGTLSAAAVVAGLMLFGLGETLWAPTGATLVNDMAPPHLRGRYNAVSSVTWQLSAVIGPVVAGALLEAGLGAELIGGLVAILLLVALLARRLERHLSPEANNARPLDPLPEEVLPIP